MDQLMGSSGGQNTATNPMVALQMLQGLRQGGFQGLMNAAGQASGGGNLGGGKLGQMPMLGSLFNTMTQNVPMSNAALSSIAGGSLLGGAGAGAGGAAAGAAGAAGGGGILSMLLGLIGL